MNNKMTILCAAFMMTVASFTFTSCGEADNHSHDDDKNVKVEETTKKEAEAKTVEPEHVHTAEFQCPMECEGDKTYAEAGTCPACKMDLKELKHDHVEEVEHTHDHGDHEHGDDHGHDH